MKKIIREVDEKRGIHQITIADERWYMKSATNKVTGLPEYIPVPSMTWIAGCYPKGIGYYRWLAEHGWDEAEAIKTAAGDKGTKVHLAIEDVHQGKEVRIDSCYLNKSIGIEEELTIDECDAVLSFLAWKKEMESEYIIETVTFEKTVFSEKHNYAGTIDWIMILTHKETKEKSVWIIDFKTSQNIFDSHKIQLNGYKRTIENGENPIIFNEKPLDVSNVKMAILQVGYRKNKNQYKFTEIESDFSIVEDSIRIWKREHGEEKPNKRDYPIVLSPALNIENIIPVAGEKTADEVIAPRIKKTIKK